MGVKKDFSRPPACGWNSWDYYRWTVTEEEVLRNAEFIASAPCLMLALAGDDAVDRWRNHLMPKIRERWGQHNDDPEKKHLNLVHGSDNPENAFRELLYFFG